MKFAVQTAFFTCQTRSFIHSSIQISISNFNVVCTKIVPLFRTGSYSGLVLYIDRYNTNYHSDMILMNIPLAVGKASDLLLFDYEVKTYQNTFSR